MLSKENDKEHTSRLDIGIIINQNLINNKSVLFTNSPLTFCCQWDDTNVGI